MCSRKVKAKRGRRRPRIKWERTRQVKGLGYHKGEEKEDKEGGNIEVGGGEGRNVQGCSKAKCK